VKAYRADSAGLSWFWLLPVDILADLFQCRGVRRPFRGNGIFTSKVPGDLHLATLVSTEPAELPSSF
jgi:hypothetical protein